MTKQNETRPFEAAGLGNLSYVAADGFENSLPPRLLHARNKIDFETINRAALSALPAVLARILPSGKIVAREYVALNPTRADRRPGSFKVNLRSGKWCDFATGDKGGDPISLVAYLEGVSQGEAAQRLARMLGLDTREGRRHG
jgi:hypothetical protein